MKYLVIGGSSVDRLIHVPDIPPIQDDMSLFATATSTNIGGTGAGKALALDVLGADTRFITGVGNDEYGEQITSFFEGRKLQFQPVTVDQSTSHTNIMHDGGKRLSIFTSHMRQMPTIPDIASKWISESDVIFLNINEFCRDYIPLLQNTNAIVVVDIHDYNPPNPYHQDFIEIADVLISSGVYIPDHQSFLEKYINHGKEIVIITNGSSGLIARYKDNTYTLPGYNNFEYVDSNGAGDSFCVGFMMKWMETKDVEEALRFGTVCGGIACTSYDLFNQEYTKSMIEDIVKGVKW